MSPVSTSESQLQVVVPKIPVGPTNINVESPDGKSGAISFEVLRSIAKITEMVPSQAKRGETIIIFGENLDKITTVRFSNDSSSAAEFTHEGNSLKVIVPQDAISGKVHISNLDGKAVSENEFIVIIKPEIIALSSDHGVENTEIEIKGKYLQNALVYFGATKVNPISNNGSAIKVKCPKFNVVEDLKIVVKTIGGEDQHIFKGAPASAISKAVPNGLIPGSALTLKGDDFFDVQSVVLPNGSKISRKEFIAMGSNEVTIKLPDAITEGNFQVVSQYGAGNTLSLNMINGGGGLNGENIANGPTGIGSIGGVSRQCGPYTIKDYYIAYYPENSPTPKPPIPGGPTFEGIFSGVLYDRCFCSEQCGTCNSLVYDNVTQTYQSVPSHCYNENETDYFYGTFRTIGDKTYRQFSGSRTCRANDYEISALQTPECKGTTNSTFGFYVTILLELEKKGTVIDKDIYTGFMIVELREIFPNNPWLETYYGNKTTSGEYILESTLGNQNRLKIKLENF